MRRQQEADPVHRVRFRVFQHVDNCEGVYLRFLIIFGGGIRCDNGWSALCDVLRIFFGSVCAFFGRPGPPVAEAGKCTNASKHMRNTSHNVDQSFSQRIPHQKVIKKTQIYPYANVYAQEHLTNNSIIKTLLIPYTI